MVERRRYVPAKAGDGPILGLRQARFRHFEERSNARFRCGSSSVLPRSTSASSLPRQYGSLSSQPKMAVYGHTLFARLAEQ